MSREALEALPAKQYLQHFHLDYYLTEALRSCDSVEQLQHFFQDVLDGSHLRAKASPSFRTVNATPENRRAFVELMRTRLGLVAPKPQAVAMTVLDFHDMLVLLLPDFPLDLIIEASDFAVRVLDTTSHRLLGQPAPSAETADGGIAAALANGEVLFSMPDLQNMVEFRLVYGEVIEATRRYYQQGHLDSSSRFDLVKTLRRQLTCDASLLGASGPSEDAWQQLLCGAGSILSSKQEHVTLLEAVREMAECFELVPSPIPEALQLKAISLPAEAPEAPSPEPEISELNFKAERSPPQERRHSGPWRSAERGSLVRSRSRA